MREHNQLKRNYSWKWLYDRAKNLLIKLWSNKEGRSCLVLSRKSMNVPLFTNMFQSALLALITHTSLIKQKQQTSSTRPPPTPYKMPLSISLSHTHIHKRNNFQRCVSYDELAANRFTKLLPGYQSRQRRTKNQRYGDVLSFHHKPLHRPWWCGEMRSPKRWLLVQQRRCYSPTAVYWIYKNFDYKISQVVCFAILDLVFLLPVLFITYFSQK
jgi:hypothetical protein